MYVSDNTVNDFFGFARFCDTTKNNKGRKVEREKRKYKIMLHRCRTCLSKWKGWDHIKGKSKSMGAVHVRHTLGSKGHYKPLKKVAHGMRDGIRHGANHMQGGLGVKLGGGLFGLRIPRQHALSHMTPDEYELEVHGHPNITNPYRHHMEHHPDVAGVVRNAKLHATFLVAMPVVSRSTDDDGTGAYTNGQHTVTLSSSPSNPSVRWTVPKRWLMALPALQRFATSLETLYASVDTSQASTALGEEIVLVLATSSASVSLTFDPSEHGEESRSSEAREELVEAMGKLYSDFVGGITIGGSQQSTKSRVPKLFGAGLASSASSYLPVSLAADPVLSMADKHVSKVASHSKSPPQATLCTPSSLSTSDVIHVEKMGLDAWIEHLRQTEPSALRLRTVLPLIPKQRKQSSSSDEGHQAPVYEPQGDLRHNACTANALLKWYVYNSDPRSHYNDLLQHSSRPLCVHTLVECAVPAGGSGVSSAEGREPPATRDSTSIPHAFKSILRRSTHNLLKSCGYQITSDRPDALAAALRHWSAFRRIVPDTPTASTATCNETQAAR